MPNNISESLPSLINDAERPDTGKPSPLVPIHAAFFIPKLENKPQNPIIDSTDLNPARISLPAPTKGVIGDLLQPATTHGNTRYFHKVNALGISPVEEEKAGENIWLIAASGSDAQGNKLKTWDGLRATYPSDATEGELLSEQHPSVFATAQEFVISHVQAPKMSRWYLQPAELLDILMTNLIGHSSRLYEWDNITEQFIQAECHKNRVIVAHGYSDDLSNDIIRQHLIIGVCLRRLDIFIIRMRRTKLHSTMHAFLHALETAVTSFRKQLQRSRPVSKTIFSQLWLHYADVEETLISLTKLCNVGAALKPPYELLPTEATALLSYIYAFVDLHFQSCSPRLHRANLAYLLSTTSSPFFRTIEHSIGIGKPKSTAPSNQPDARDEEMGGGEAQYLDIYGPPDSYPAFFSEEQQSQMAVAARSLKVLAAAAPEHPLLSEYADRRCEWVWHEEDVERIHTGHRIRPFEELHPLALPVNALTQVGEVTSHPVNYPPELASFKAFDMEPGSQWGSSKTQPTSLPINTTPYQAFLATFPEDLPSSTPTLSHLASAVLYPLKLQSNRLANALLSLFLSPPLSLPSHLSLLRSFGLLASQAFTFRLRGALFSEIEGYQPVGRGTRARTRARLGIKDARDIAAEAEEFGGPEGTTSKAKWGIGLGLGLSERGIWPPGGAELGFALRRVIVDSLDEMKVDGVDPTSALVQKFLSKGALCEEVIKEAEWRLGFAIRDLPVDEGREEWLNPSSIAALDFLYLDYKPPIPVGALITPDILSKYQRIFNFLLRLLRVETVSRGIFNTVLKGLDLFSDSPQALSLLNRFRFHAHAFLSTLITYVFDTAIGIHFDGFMSRVEDVAIRHATGTNQSSNYRYAGGGVSSIPGEAMSQHYLDDDARPVADVFEIMADHSLVLDKILGSCVLRTQQRAISEVLEDILTVMLRLGTLVRDLNKGALNSMDAAAQLEKLHYTFERKMITFTKVLRAMDDKSELRSLLSALATSDWDYEVLSRNAGGQKREIGLSDLLARLDPGEWWKHEADRRAKAKKEKQGQSRPDE